MKKITIIVRNLPLNTRRNAEALRMSVGLTLREDEIKVIFMDNGVYTATSINPELIGFNSHDKEFEALSMLKCPMLADKPSLKKRGIKNLRKEVRVAEREEIIKVITESDIVIPF